MKRWAELQDGSTKVLVIGPGVGIEVALVRDSPTTKTFSACISLPRRRG